MSNNSEGIFLEDIKSIANELVAVNESKIEAKRTEIIFLIDLNIFPPVNLLSVLN